MLSAEEPVEMCSTELMRFSSSILPDMKPVFGTIFEAASMIWKKGNKSYGLSAVSSAMHCTMELAATLLAVCQCAYPGTKPH